jgi:formate-dependent nitrite reductase membrane component NrfD
MNFVCVIIAYVSLIFGLTINPFIIFVFFDSPMSMSYIVLQLLMSFLIFVLFMSLGVWHEVIQDSQPKAF